MKYIGVTEFTFDKFAMTSILDRKADKQECGSEHRDALENKPWKIKSSSILMTDKKERTKLELDLKSEIFTKDQRFTQ